MGSFFKRRNKSFRASRTVLWKHHKRSRISWTAPQIPLFIGYVLWIKWSVEIYFRERATPQPGFALSKFKSKIGNRFEPPLVDYFLVFIRRFLWRFLKRRERLVSWASNRSKLQPQCATESAIGRIRTSSLNMGQLDLGWFHFFCVCVCNNDSCALKVFAVYRYIFGLNTRALRVCAISVFETTFKRLHSALLVCSVKRKKRSLYVPNFSTCFQWWIPPLWD